MAFQTEEQRQKAFQDAGITKETMVSNPANESFGFKAPIIPEQITSEDISPINEFKTIKSVTPITISAENIPVPDIPEIKKSDLIQESLSEIEKASAAFEERPTREKAIGLEAGVVDLRKQAIELSKQIQLHKAQAFKAEQQAAELGETESGQAAAIRRVQSENTYKSLELAAQAEALTGNLSLAKELAGQAVDERFKGEEARLNTLAKNIRNNFDKMTSVQKKQALETLDKIKAQEAFVKTQKEEQKGIDEQIIKVAATGKATNEQLAEIRNADSVEEAARLSVPFLEKRLSVSEAKALGVPFGTTEREAEGIVPTISQEFGLVDSIIANPQLFETLTPSVKTALIPSLAQVGFKFPRKLSAEQDKAQANATSALLAISQMESQLFNPDGSVNRKALIAATSGLGSLAFQRREAIDVLTRIRTGAALNESEQTFYSKQGPRVWDDKNTIEQKLTQLKALYSGIAGTSLTLQSPDGKTYVYEDMFNPEARTEVRRAISNGYKIIRF